MDTNKNALTLDDVQRLADRKGLKVLYNPDNELFPHLPYCVTERNDCVEGGTFWMARTLRGVLDGLERELPRREWREADNAAVWCWYEAEGKEAMRKAGVDERPAAERRRWWRDVGRNLQREWAARNPDHIARWRSLNQDE
jgi:hypothetical protein